MEEADEEPVERFDDMDLVILDDADETRSRSGSRCRSRSCSEHRYRTKRKRNDSLDRTSVDSNANSIARRLEGKMNKRRCERCSERRDNGIDDRDKEARRGEDRRDLSRRRDRSDESRRISDRDRSLRQRRTPSRERDMNVDGRVFSNLEEWRERERERSLERRKNLERDRERSLEERRNLNRDRDRSIEKRRVNNRDRERSFDKWTSSRERSLERRTNSVRDRERSLERRKISRDREKSIEERRKISSRGRERSVEERRVLKRDRDRSLDGRGSSKRDRERSLEDRKTSRGGSDDGRRNLSRDKEREYRERDIYNRDRDEEREYKSSRGREKRCEHERTHNGDRGRNVDDRRKSGSDRGEERILSARNRVAKQRDCECRDSRGVLEEETISNCIEDEEEEVVYLDEEVIETENDEEDKRSRTPPEVSRRRRRRRRSSGGTKNNSEFSDRNNSSSEEESSTDGQSAHTNATGALQPREHTPLPIYNESVRECNHVSSLDAVRDKSLRGIEDPRMNVSNLDQSTRMWKEIEKYRHRGMLLAVGLHPLDRADLTKIAKLFSWVSSDFEIYMRSAKDNSGSAFGSLERISHLGEFFIGLLKLVPLQNRYVTVGLKNVALIPVYEVYCTLDLSQSEAIKDLISSKNAQLQAKDTEKNEEQYRELAIDNVPCGIPSETFLYLFPTVIRAEYCWKERDELAAGISDVHSHSPGHSEKKCVVADVFTEDEVQLADNSEMEHLPGAGKVFSSHMQDDEYAGDQGSLKPGAPEVADSGASGISERKTEMTDCSETEVAEADTPTGKPELGDTSEMRIPEAVSGGMESHMADTSGLGQSMTADIPLEDAEKADNSGEGRPEADISEGQAHAVEQLAEQDQVEDNSTDGCELRLIFPSEDSMNNFMELYVDISVNGTTLNVVHSGEVRSGFSTRRPPSAKSWSRPTVSGGLSLSNSWIRPCEDVARVYPPLWVDENLEDSLLEFKGHSLKSSGTDHECEDISEPTSVASINTEGIDFSKNRDKEQRFENHSENLEVCEQLEHVCHGEGQSAPFFKESAPPETENNVRTGVELLDKAPLCTALEETTADELCSESVSHYQMTELTCERSLLDRLEMQRSNPDSHSPLSDIDSTSSNNDQRDGLPFSDITLKAVEASTVHNALNRTKGETSHSFQDFERCLGSEADHNDTTKTSASGGRYPSHAHRTEQTPEDMSRVNMAATKGTVSEPENPGSLGISAQRKSAKGAHFGIDEIDRMIKTENHEDKNSLDFLSQSDKNSDKDTFRASLLDNSTERNTGAQSFLNNVNRHERITPNSSPSEKQLLSSCIDLMNDSTKLSSRPDIKDSFFNSAISDPLPQPVPPPDMTTPVFKSFAAPGTSSLSPGTEDPIKATWEASIRRFTASLVPGDSFITQPAENVTSQAKGLDTVQYTNGGPGKSGAFMQLKCPSTQQTPEPSGTDKPFTGTSEIVSKRDSSEVCSEISEHKFEKDVYVLPEQVKNGVDKCARSNTDKSSVDPSSLNRNHDQDEETDLSQDNGQQLKQFSSCTNTSKIPSPKPLRRDSNKCLTQTAAFTPCSEKKGGKGENPETDTQGVGGRLNASHNPDTDSDILNEEVVYRGKVLVTKYPEQKHRGDELTDLVGAMSDKTVSQKNVTKLLAKDESQTSIFQMKNDMGTSLLQLVSPSLPMNLQQIRVSSSSCSSRKSLVQRKRSLSQTLSKSSLRARNKNPRQSTLRLSKQTDPNVLEMLKKQIDKLLDTKSGDGIEEETGQRLPTDDRKHCQLSASGSEKTDSQRKSKVLRRYDVSGLSKRTRKIKSVEASENKMYKSPDDIDKCTTHGKSSKPCDISKSGMKESETSKHLKRALNTDLNHDDKSDSMKRKSLKMSSFTKQNNIDSSATSKCAQAVFVASLDNTNPSEPDTVHQKKGKVLRDVPQLVSYPVSPPVQTIKETCVVRFEETKAPRP